MSVIVVGLDGSDTSWDAFSWGLGQAARSGGRLVVVFVTPVGETGGAMGVPFDFAAAEQIRHQIGADLEREARERAGELSLPVTFRHEHGDAVDALTKVATAEHADLVVVGRSTKKRHQLMGSLGKRLVCREDAPVIVVVP